MKLFLEIYQTLIAGMVGAIVTGVVWYITNRKDAKKQQYERRFYIFRTLLTNIQNVVSHEFVSAFNLILVEYDKDSEVRLWHNKFLEHVWSDPVKTDADVIKFNDIKIKLIEALAKSIDIEIEQLDIKNKVYWPQGFVNTVETQRQLTNLLMENLNKMNNVLDKIDNSTIKVEIKN